MPSLPLPAILYQDDRHVILNKPAGLPCHAGRVHAQSVESFFPSLSRRRSGPWLAHRLDRDTAGCLLVALRRDALLAAQSAFSQRRVIKLYWAVVVGRPPEASGSISAALSKRTIGRRWQMVNDPHGEEAVTCYRLLGSGDGISAVSFEPKTGRTHQIRIHASLLGCPLLGDPIYGEAAAGGLQLLARALSLGTGSSVRAIAPIPPHMQAAVAACGINPTKTTDETGLFPANSVA